MATNVIQPELIPASDKYWKPKEDALTQGPSLMGLIDYAVKNQSAIEVIKELRAMQMFDDAKRAERDFNEALESAQNEVSEVVPDAMNEQTGKKYASFKALNALLRPVYLRHKFTLSFNAAPSPNPEEIHVICDVSHKGGCTKQYMIPMSTDNKGPKGGGVMSKQQAFAAAASYGRSILLKMIFNIAIGEEIKPETPEWLTTYFERMANCKSIETLQAVYKEAYREADSKSDTESLKALVVKMTEERRRIQRSQQQ
jgi:hypothetical protein